MPRRRIGRETFGFEWRDTGTALDELSAKARFIWPSAVDGVVQISAAHP